MTASMRAELGATRRWLYTTAGCVVLVLAWAWAAHGQHEYVLPSPLSAFRALSEIVTHGQFWHALGLTVMRGGIGLGLAIIIGALWGSAMGRWPAFEAFCQPMIQILLATPAVVFVILALVWLGSSSEAVMLVVALVATPLLVRTTATAVRGIDPSLSEMGQVFGLSRYERAWHIIVPLVLPPFLAATTVALGQSLRVAVMAELLATASGLGGAIRLAQINIETPQVFAYALLLATLALIIEKLSTAPLQRRLAVVRGAG